MSGWQNLDVVTYPGTGALDMPGVRRCTGLQVTEFVDLTRAFYGIPCCDNGHFDKAVGCGCSDDFIHVIVGSFLL